MTDRIEKEKLIAIWSISLNTECPACGQYVDLLDYSDFWHDHSILKPVENYTDNSRDVLVCCPECSSEFLVDLEY